MLHIGVVAGAPSVDLTEKREKPTTRRDHHGVREDQESGDRSNSRRESVFTEERVLDPDRLMVMGGSDLFNLWGTAEAVTVGAGDNASSTLSPFFPDPGATRLCVVRHAPRSHGAASGATPEQVRAEAEERHPGLADGLASDSSGMHTTDSVDYAICVDGELWLELDDGAAVHVTPGTFVVQRGTRHAWRNRSDDHCTMIYVIIGASRIS